MDFEEREKVMGSIMNITVTFATKIAGFFLRAFIITNCWLQTVSFC